MRMHVRPIGLAGTMALLGLLSACDVATVSEARVSQAVLAPTDGIEIRTRNGTVTVASDEDADGATISAEVRATSQERLEGIAVTLDHADDGTLLIGVDPPDGTWRRGEGASFDVVVPGAHNVHVRTSNGAVRIAGLAGTADLGTSNGDVQVRDHDGDVTIDTSNGGIILHAIHASVHAVSANGSIEADDLAGSVSLATSNGPITVTLGDRGVGPLKLHTSNGAIRVELGKNYAGSLTASTSNGDVRVGGTVPGGARVDWSSDQSAHVVVGEGGAESTVTTSNASVTIHFPS